VLRLPTESLARTEKVWEPSASPLYVFGLVHAASGAPSSEQTNVTPVCVSEKAKLAVFAFVRLGGFESIVGAGGGATLGFP
jgi:hypothetical protein